MHELFNQVLSQRDLSKAGDLFSLEDKDIEDDLSEVIYCINDIAKADSYLINNNDQSVVEICINRVTAAIRETGSIEKHAPALVTLLDTCLKNNLQPTSKEEDPPHTKIASDVLSCVFLNYNKKSVMEHTLPIAVRFLQQGNRELSHNMSSYLSLAAIDNARLLADQIYTILDSMVYHKNKSLARVLLQIYSENKDPIHDHIPKLVQLLRESDASETNSLLQLFGLVAKDRPKMVAETHAAAAVSAIQLHDGAFPGSSVNSVTTSFLLETFLPQLSVYLSLPSMSPVVLPIFVDMAGTSPEPFVNLVTQLKQTAEQQPANLGQVAQVLGAVGRIDKTHGKDIVAWLVGQLASADNHTLPLLLKEIKAIAEAFPSILPEHMITISKYSDNGLLSVQIVIQQLKELSSKSVILEGQNATLSERKTVGSQTEGIVTVINISNPASKQAKTDQGSTYNAKLLTTHTRSASTSTREINFPLTGSSVAVTTSAVMSLSGSVAMVTSGSNSVLHSSMGTSSSSRLPSVSQMLTLSQSFGDRPTAMPPAGHVTSVATITRTTVAGSKAQDRKPMPTVSTTTMPTYVGQPQAIPFPDAVQHFCEKHLDKIKTYIDNVSARLPIPIKAVKAETKRKHCCKLNFICFGQGPNCLYSDTFFTMKTKNARIWIHLMFLAIQARSQKAVSQQDPSVGNLKALWDSLKQDRGNFVRLVTSSFPSAKDQETLLHELQSIRYFDLFEFNALEKHWACFLCNHPEKALGLMEDGSPVIEGKLKEKKGKWKIFKRWKTRYLTLSGATITYNKKDTKASLPVNKIHTVKAVRRGMRDIPKAFEIFTNDQTYVFKASDSKHAEQWVQCLQIAVARAQKQEKVTEFDLENWAVHRQNQDHGLSTIPSTSTSAASSKMKNTQTKL